MSEEIKVGDKVECSAPVCAADHEVWAIHGDWAWVSFGSVMRGCRFQLTHLSKVKPKWETGKTYRWHSAGYPSLRFRCVDVAEDGAAIGWESHLIEGRQVGRLKFAGDRRFWTEVES